MAQPLSLSVSSMTAPRAKLEEIIGLYDAVALSVDEKSQIQALDRTQPGLPMKKGRAGTVTHGLQAAYYPVRGSQCP